MADPKKIKSLSDLRDKEDEEEDEDETNRWFTGGGKSGLQVQAPKTADEIMRNAMKSGAKKREEVEEEKKHFEGTGYRLGVLPDAPSQSVSSNRPRKTQKKMMIYLWKNGFSVDDGPLRDPNDPDGQLFFAAINRGLIPKELQDMSGDSELIVDVTNRETEDYKPPPMKPFSGQGQSLGSTKSTAPAPVSSSTTSTGKQVEVDESQPVTSIQVRLLDGSRLVIKCNHTHKVKDIRAHINSVKPSSVAYDLMTSFPQKAITDEEQTLKEANLLNAAIIQKAR